MQIPVYNIKGEATSQIEVDDTVFGIPMNRAVVHQALVRQLANARQGTASTKTRGEVSGGTRKLYHQKHTGLARAGSRRSPLRRGGGVVFGPKPRDYRQRMPKKMRRLALRCLLSDKVANGELKVIGSLELDEPKTKGIIQILDALGAKPSTLLVTADADANVYKSARNLSRVKTLPAPLLNVVDLLSYRVLVATVDAVRRAEAIWGKESAKGIAS